MFRFLLAGLVMGSSGCTGGRPQSILEPAGPHAGMIATLWWEMFAVYGIVFLVTLVLVGLALIVRRKERPALGQRFVFVAGIGIPAVILIVMLISTIRVSLRLSEGSTDFHVRVIGHHWWFEVQYPDHAIVDANEIHVPADSMVRFELSSAHVIHSFWVPRLGGKLDLLPDHPNHLRLQSGRPGVYEGTCTEYCAGPHALMEFRLVVHDRDDFERWLEQRRQPPPAPSDPRLVRGRDVFLNGGCAACHTIKGVSGAQIGPDLSHVGSRRTLGAGRLVNTPGYLAGWIANPQTLKPRNLMPRSYLSPEDLHTLVDYLGSLR